MATQPDLGITNPYALDQTQFDAAIALLEEQKALAGQYWADYVVQADSMVDGTVLAGTTWQVVATYAQGRGAKIDAVKPKEGATGWSRHLDAVVEGEQPELHEAVDGLDLVAVGQRPGDRVLRRGAEQPRGLRADGQSRPLHQLPCRGRGVLDRRVVLDHRDRGVPRRPHRRHVRALHGMGQRLERVAGMGIDDVASGGELSPPPRSARTRQPLVPRSRRLAIAGILTPPVRVARWSCTSGR